VECIVDVVPRWDFEFGDTDELPRTLCFRNSQTPQIRAFLRKFFSLSLTFGLANLKERPRTGLKLRFCQVAFGQNGCFSVFGGFQGHAFSCEHEKHVLGTLVSQTTMHSYGFLFLNQDQVEDVVVTVGQEVAGDCDAARVSRVGEGE